MISLRTLISAFLLAMGISALSWLKVSFLVGSQMAAFSLAHCVTPLIGILLGGFGALFYFCFKTLLRLCIHTATTNMALACHLPTLSAGLYLSALSTHKYTISFTKKLALTVIPVACIMLFCCHTVGAQAWAYSLFWFIPLAALMVPHTSLFFHMLGSTFTAHAVGSVLWLYCVPGLTPQMWLNLMPVVAVERLLFASGMYLMYHMLQRLSIPAVISVWLTPSTKEL